MQTESSDALASLARPGHPSFRLADSVQALQQALAQGRTTAIERYFDGLAPADIGDMLRKLEQPALSNLLDLVPTELRTEVFTYLPMSQQLEHVATLGRAQRTALFHDMPPDERVDLFLQLSLDEQQALLPALAQAEREDIRRLASYSEHTAGAIMTSEYASLKADQSVEQALLELRRIAPDRESIYTAYVVDDHRRLIGVTSLQDLFLSEPNTHVRDVMVSRVVRARVSDPKHEAAAKIAKFDLLSLPIIDDNDQIVGIITADDAMDVAQAQSTATMHKGSGVGELPETLLHSTIPTLYKNVSSGL